MWSPTLLLLGAFVVFSHATDNVCPFGVENLTDQFGNFSRFTPCHNNYVGPTEQENQHRCLTVCKTDPDCVSAVWSEIREECYHWSYKLGQENGCKNCYLSSFPELCSTDLPCVPVFKQCLCSNGDSFPANEIALDCKQDPVQLLENCQAHNSCPAKEYGGLIGTIHSPNYPNSYFEHSNCSYQITVPEQFAVRLTFVAFDTQSCCDHVAIYDGQSTDAPLIARISGTLFGRSKEFKSSANKLLVTFESDSTVSLSGFEANYQAIINSYTQTTPQPFGTGTTAVQTTRATTTAPSCDCPRNSYPAPFGVIHSPNYPNDYCSNENCDYLIQAGPDHIIELTFTEFETEGCCDTLTIYDGSSDSGTVIGFLHGEEDLKTYRSTGPNMFLHFFSDDSVNKPGFRALYKKLFAKVSTPPPTTTNPLCACPWPYYNGPEGSISSPNYPQDYCNGMTCFYHVSVQEDAKIRLEIVDFLTEAIYDYVQIFDGTDIDANELMELSGENLDGLQVVSTGSAMTIKFHSDLTYNRRGFNATYKQIIATPTPTPKSTVTPSKECGPGWVFDPRGRRCYRYMPRMVDWQKAVELCSEMASNLVSIHNNDQNQFVIDLIKSSTTGADRWHTWIGLKIWANGFRWTDNSDVDYVDWLPGEPNMHTGYSTAIQAWEPSGWLLLKSDLESGIRPFVCAKWPNDLY